MRRTMVPRSSGGRVAAGAAGATPAPPVQAPPPAQAPPPPDAPPPEADPAGTVPRPRGALPAGAGGSAAGLGDRLRSRFQPGGRFHPGGRFRLPGRHDPAPHPARLFGVCAWSAGLGLLGLPVAGRSSVAIITHAAPAWFEPTVVAVGLLGMGLTVGALAAIHRALCWHLLLAATGLLAVNLLLTLLL